MFNKEKLKKQICDLEYAIANLMLWDINDKVTRDRVANLEELKNTLEKIYTTMTSEDSI